MRHARRSPEEAAAERRVTTLGKGGTMQFDLARRLAAEALGTFFLVMAVVGSGIMAEKLAGGNEAIALLCNTLPTGAVLFVIITIFISRSEEHTSELQSLRHLVCRL